MISLIRSAVEQGVAFFDTAEVYARHHVPPPAAGRTNPAANARPP
jgi:aryl-alcohol dehydrogenase-like predicted oxidoreductase